MLNRKWASQVIAMMTAVALFAGIGAVALPVVPIRQDAKIATVKAAVLNKKKAKKTLKKWLKQTGQYDSSLSIVYDSFDGENYTFQYCEDLGDHVSTVNWFDVNKYTGAVSSMF